MRDRFKTIMFYFFISDCLRTADIMPSERQLRSGKVVSDTIERDEPAEKKRKVATPATRSSSDVYLIGQPNSSISGSQLPTCRQVFQYFLHLRNKNPNSDNRSLAIDTVDVILPFWNMARIKTLTRPNAVNRFMILHEKYRKIVKNKGRDNKPEEEKRTDFLKDLDKLFDIGTKDAVNKIKANRLLTNEDKEEDVNFYLDQQTTRQAHMSGHDKVFEKKYTEKNFREEREKRLLSSVTAAAAEVGEISTDDVSENSHGSAISECSEYTEPTPGSPRPGCSSKPSTITLHFPRSVMTSEEICSTADRLSLSDNQTTAMVSAVLKAGGADLDDFAISASTTRRKRINTRYNLSQSYMNDFKEHPPDYCTLHWDGKLLRDVLGETYPVECLSVLVSGAPHYEEGKLLGVPFIESSTGIQQCNATLELIQTWGLTDNIVGLVFDTTASNSGINKGAVKLIEEKLNKKVFYFACRHHISEVIIGGAWEAVFGNVKSPDNPMFKNLKEKWDKLNKDCPRVLGMVEQDLKQKKTSTIAVLSNFLEKASPRADFREVAELCLILLGQEPPRGIHWAKPGAIHQARWMAINIYCTKMLMFSKELKYNEDTIIKLKRINTFLALFYTSHWVTTTSAADAPIHDLQLMKDMLQYKQHDYELVTSVLKKINNHRWYLTQELVTFTLFSSHDSMTKSAKEKLAVKLSETEKPDSYRKGKPVFPDINAATYLTDLVGPESRFLFDALGVECNWLTNPADTWEDNDNYKFAQKFVRSVKVTNDVAERGVKLMSDFATQITTDPEQRSCLLQVVEYHRNKFQSFKKATLNK